MWNGIKMVFMTPFSVLTTVLQWTYVKLLVPLFPQRQNQGITCLTEFTVGLRTNTWPTLSSRLLVRAQSISGITLIQRGR